MYKHIDRASSTNTDITCFCRTRLIQDWHTQVTQLSPGSKSSMWCVRRKAAKTKHQAVDLRHSAFRSGAVACVRDPCVGERWSRPRKRKRSAQPVPAQSPSAVLEVA
ncbi:Hypothetical_protein [Hexamita inflata]|uniref:Hypothetical_protein n=1 Tax=Hexamita inflata TaxID=28002 RepID=A0AA86Q4X5_9EUKA|nr:Hypothetical protein HINF_LOCUS1579 [Hexamita inflata]CAI9913936.1 Hypothetical protein HINF_LOCUS1581 [Hexamita inflata]CAI9952380.1 Hypothetical protein HINF_LOCUS40025 [Hexamita inflata]CAI9952384.1 Hypothetical protein HINF_LOCUS40029 [Hexamita inflata]